jgi:uncharacterized SAM-binding protein YcdF (DUF218 family)
VRANGGEGMPDSQESSHQTPRGRYSTSGPKPIEPESSKTSRASWLKWIIILIFIAYVLFSYLNVPILTAMGEYLVLSHPPQKSDLIVCLAGENVENGLAAADALNQGLASKVFVAREEPPDGYQTLRQRGVAYPETIDLICMILKGLGVTESAIIKGERPVKSVWEEAEQVRELIKRKNYRSVLLITSPTHARRAYLTFRQVIGEKECRLLVMPSKYSNFKPEAWWQNRKYLEDVISEYQKLIALDLKSLF